MANEEHLAILKQGVEAWNKWRREHAHVGPDLMGAYLSGAKLSGAELREANMGSADLSAADLSGANLWGTHLSDANLGYANLRGANLIGANLRSADLRGAHLHHANLRSASLWGADVSSAQLISADLRGANLSDADLHDAYLWNADLSRARLRAANLSVAHLRGANMHGADLRRAIFVGADLRGANLSLAQLRDANFSEVTVGWTIFAGVDLSNVESIGAVEHMGPSSIGIDTVYNSMGKIPDSFLRGAGVPEKLIEYMRSLTGTKFYSCFISYSSNDQEFADQLHGDLQSKGIRCWFAPEDLKIGDPFRVRIDESILVYDKLLLILSAHSVSSSWVEKEVETAMEKERDQNRTVLFPIRLDDAVMDSKTGWAADIRRTRHIGDFRQWKNHDAYQKAFERLLRDLKAEGGEKEGGAGT